MTVKEVKEKLSKRANIFETGGKRPTGELLESWIGSVRWQHEDESLPIDNREKLVVILHFVSLVFPLEMGMNLLCQSRQMRKLCLIL